MTNEQMKFPETWEEYEREYGFNDSEEVYTNNSRLIPSFRVKQWLDHLKQEPINKSAMMYDIYMEGVNMSGEYQGCWVRFKDIKKIVDKYTRGEET